MYNKYLHIIRINNFAIYCWLKFSLAMVMESNANLTVEIKMSLDTLLRRYYAIMCICVSHIELF